MTTIATLLAALTLHGAPAPEPPVLHIGPPPGPNVECRQATFRDEVRGRSWTLRICFRTRPAFPRGRIIPA